MNLNDFENVQNELQKYVETNSNLELLLTKEQEKLNDQIAKNEFEKSY